MRQCVRYWADHHLALAAYVSSCNKHDSARSVFDTTVMALIRFVLPKKIIPDNKAIFRLKSLHFGFIN